MPIYEYECRGCRGRFEFMQSMSEAPKETCEACGGSLERMISPAGFVLKGGGWYKDLYASPKPAGAGGSSDGAKETKSGDTKKDPGTSGTSDKK